MAQLMLVNPKKRTTRGKRKAMRTAKQKAATRKLVAFNKRRAKGKRRPARRNPAKRRTVAKRVAVSAPSRRTGRRPTKRLTARRKRNTVRSYFPNPRTRKGMIQNIIQKQLQPAAIQASGAIGLDVFMGYFGNFIPAQLNTGMLRHVTKGVAALGLGFVASNFVKNGTANEMAKGALTVTMHDAFKEAMQQFMPAIPLGDVGYYNVSPVYNASPSPDGVGYFETQAGSGYSDKALGYFSQDSGQGYADLRARAEPEVFDTSDGF